MSKLLLKADGVYVCEDVHTGHSDDAKEFNDMEEIDRHVKSNMYRFRGSVLEVMKKVRHGIIEHKKYGADSYED